MCNRALMLRFGPGRCGCAGVTSTPLVSACPASVSDKVVLAVARRRHPDPRRQHRYARDNRPTALIHRTRHARGRDRGSRNPAPLLHVARYGIELSARQSLSIRSAGAAPPELVASQDL